MKGWKRFLNLRPDRPLPLKKFLRTVAHQGRPVYRCAEQGCDFCRDLVRALGQADGPR